MLLESRDDSREYVLSPGDNLVASLPTQRLQCRIRLSALHGARELGDLNAPGFNFHGLQGKPKRHSIRVNGPWRITFEWIDGDAWRVDLEQYH